MAKVAILGAGVMGLGAASRALRLGHDVTVIEAAPTAGGMAAHFDLGGLSIERFYHFICKSDRTTFEVLGELGIADRLRWRRTSMGYFSHGALHRWGDPFALLAYPHLSLIEKIRYGALMFVSVKRERWDALEHRDARHWIAGWCGERVYRELWERLFALKFYEYADTISASWIWTRVKRIGRSRRGLLAEELGYLDGGSETLVAALLADIERRGGRVLLGEAARQVRTDGGCVIGVETAKGCHPADAVISTVPTPLVGRLVPDLTASERAAYDAIANIGVVCAVLKLRRSVSPHFWVNIVDPDINVPGIIEFSNLRPTGADAVVFVPFYMPVGNPLWPRPDKAFLDDALAAVRRVNPAIGAGDVIASHVGRLTHAQPVCPPGFAARLPPVRTSIRGLQIADTCFYYPEDRGMSESLRLGRAMAEAIGGAR